MPIFKMSIWEHIVQYLTNGQELAFLFVVRSEGSSPGRKGFCMIVNTEGEMAGSIGGGIMEQKLVELARSKLTSGEFNPFIMDQVHRKDNTHNQSGMICSGEQTVAFYRLDATHIELFRRVVSCFNSGSRGVLELTHEGISFSDEAVLDNPFLIAIPNNDSWLIRHALGFASKVYILGGGHVGSALSVVMRQIGFYVTIFDDRSELNTMENNRSAHEKHYVDYASVCNHVPEGDNVYVAIVSFGYRTDKEVLKKWKARN